MGRENVCGCGAILGPGLPSRLLTVFLRRASLSFRIASSAWTLPFLPPLRLLASGGGGGAVSLLSEKPTD